MSKNMTRKGLALGSVVALAVSGFAGLPANAAGIDNGSVSLAPNGGAEYNIIAGAAFELKSNMATGVVQSGTYLKFLVEDANSDMSVQGGQYVAVPTAAVGTGATNTLALTIADHLFKAGDKVSLTGVTYNSDGTAAISNFTDGTSNSKEALTITIDGAYAVGDVITVEEVATADVNYTVTAANVAAVAPTESIAAGLLAAITGATGALYDDNVSTGAVINIDGKTDANQTDVPAVTFTRVNLAALTDVAISAVVPGQSGTITVPSAAAISDDIGSGGGYSSAKATISTSGNRAANGSFIVDTKNATNSADKVLRLKSAAKNSTQTAVVTAWVDSNDNGLIDTTEYASPARTVSFLASTAITPTVTMLPAYVDESTVKAEVTFAPVLNGVQLTNGVSGDALDTVIEALQVEFTRPGSTKTIAAAEVTYSNVTKKFTATSVAMSNNLVNNEDATNRAAGWNISQPALFSNLAITSAQIKTNVITVTTAAHGLQVGDVVKVSGALTTKTFVNEAAAIVTSVPTTTTFTYKSTSASAITDDATTAVPGGTPVVSATVPQTGANHTNTAQSPVTVAGTKILRNAVVPGQYSAQALLYRYTNVSGESDELTKIGSASGLTVGATTADDGTLEGVVTATVNAAGKVAKGATTAQVVLSVLDEDDDAVAAGIPVTITAVRNTGAGILKVNGTTLVGTTTSTLAGVTDANGQVVITVENSIGAAGDRVDLTTNAQGVPDSLNVVWENPKYSIVDSADATANSSARNRAADANGAYTFDLWVQDQFKNFAPADIRLLATITGRTTQTTPVVLTNGRASVTVTPDGSAITGDTTVKMNFQKRSTLGVWATQDGEDDYIDWFAAGNNDLAPVLIKFYSQTDAVNLNANGANFPSSVAADLTADVTTVAYKANDARVTTGVAATYTTAQKAVVSGNVANSVTGASKAGASVTISGAGLLFNVGDVWAADSITFVSGDGAFNATVVSRSAGAKVVTVTSGAATKTATVTFSAVSAVTGYSVKLTAPASVPAGSTYRIDGQVLDVNGNGIAITTAGTGTNPTLSVSYMGLGLVSGALPATTDKDGKFFFYVLVGTNDKGSAVVTASYDADGTGTASKAVTTSATVFVGQSAPSDAKVNAGSFKGFVAVYARGYEGKRLSAKIGNDWVIVPALASNFERVTDFTGAGVSISVRIYIDRVLTATIPLVTK